MTEAPTKRRKYNYDADGRRILSVQTLRRHTTELKCARRAELLAYVDKGFNELQKHPSIIGDNPPQPTGSLPQPAVFLPQPAVSSPQPGGASPASAGSSPESVPFCLRRRRADEQAVPSFCNIEELLTSTRNEINAAPSSEKLYDETIQFHDDVSYDNLVENSDSSDQESIGSSIEEATLQQNLRSTPAGPASASISSHTVTDSSSPSFNVQNIKDYILSDGDTVMFKESNLKTWQVILVILGFCTRFSLSMKARRALIEVTKLFAGPEFSSWDISDYYLSKIFDAPDEVILYHFYCQTCCRALEKPVTKRKLKNHEAVCEHCLHTYTISANSPNYFVSLDLKYQITSLLNSTVIREGLASNLHNTRTEVRGTGIIRDVYDGLLYKKLVSETPQDSQLLTYTFNTDGAPLFHSSKRAFWPILVILNELPPGIRFRYPLLAGLCIVRKEPSADLMNTYMESFVRQANKLNIEGFYARIGEKDVHFVLKPLLCSVDSVARPLLQNRLQFNGYHGCSWCYCMGVHKHGCMRFLLEENDSADRTHNDYLKDVEAATKKVRSAVNLKTKKQSNVRGVKGYAILTELLGFDMVWGFVRDYLHGDLIGVVSQLWSMWCDPQCPIHLTKAQQDEVNTRLMKMTPPQEIHRLVRPLKSEKSKWKASEWRSWLLFYAIPCLTEIIDNYALQHFTLYVNSVHTLLQTRITEEELDRVQYALYEFVVIFEVLYGEKHLTFNVHSLKHLVRCVRCCGPLWATSTFPFESAIYDLKRYVHGPKGVYEQMSMKAVQVNVFHSLVSELEQTPACIQFHQSLFGRSEVASFWKSEGVVLIGKGQPQSQHEGKEILTFRRCIFSGMIVHSVAYNRPTKSNDTMFFIKGGKLGQVLNLLYFDGIAFAQIYFYKVRKVKLLRVSNEQCRKHCPVIENVVVNRLYEIYAHECDGIVRVTDIREKCIVIDIDAKSYISRLPNTYEIQ